MRDMTFAFIYKSTATGIFCLFSVLWTHGIGWFRVIFKEGASRIDMRHCLGKGGGWREGTLHFCLTAL